MPASNARYAQLGIVCDPLPGSPRSPLGVIRPRGCRRDAVLLAIHP